MKVLLVRHGRAGKREQWQGDDRLRPLDKRGRKQAEGLVRQLADYPVERIVSSCYLRCTQTVEPLASARGVIVEPRDELAEGSTREDVVRLLGELDGDGVVLCTHGDVVEELVGLELPKGSTQVFDADGGRLVSREYLPPPAGLGRS
jgi:phosphohistidine phosphatase SixA